MRETIEMKVASDMLVLGSLKFTAQIIMLIRSYTRAQCPSTPPHPTASPQAPTPVRQLIRRSILK